MTMVRRGRGEAGDGEAEGEGEEVRDEVVSEDEREGGLALGIRT
jgi:hypothetical protein